jgi:hypothetical protein
MFTDNVNQHLCLAVPRDEPEDAEKRAGDQDTRPDEEARSDKELHEGPYLRDRLLLGRVER